MACPENKRKSHLTNYDGKSTPDNLSVPILVSNFSHVKALMLFLTLLCTSVCGYIMVDEVERPYPFLVSMYNSTRMRLRWTCSCISYFVHPDYNSESLLIGIQEWSVLFVSQQEETYYLAQLSSEM